MRDNGDGTEGKAGDFDQGDRLPGANEPGSASRFTLHASGIFSARHSVVFDRFLLDDDPVSRTEK